MMVRSLPLPTRSLLCCLSRTNFPAAICHHSKTLSNASIPLKSIDAIPGPKALPFIGTAWAFLPVIGKYKISRIFESCIMKFQEYGGIVKDIRPINEYFVTLYDPNDFEVMFRHEGRYPYRLELSAFKKYQQSKPEWKGTLGLLVSQGDEWHHLRSKVQPHIMKPRSMHMYIPGLAGVADDFVYRMKYMRDGNEEVSDVVAELNKWALESVSLVALDRRLGCLSKDLPADSEAQCMITTINQIFDIGIKLEFSPFHFWKYLPSLRWHKFAKGYDYFSSTVVKYVTEAINNLKQDDSTEREMTLLQSFLTTKDMEMEEVLVFLLDLFFAGVDTTSTASAFNMYHLARNPDAQVKAAEEVKKVLPSKDTPITPAALNELRYLKACIKESLRLNPLVIGTTRALDHDVQIKGYHIPAGTIVTSNFGVSSHLEEYFPEPKKFHPERWLTSKKDFHPFLTLPFSFGARGCIGRRLAEQEMELLLIKVLQNFHLEYHHEDIGMTLRGVLSPDRPVKLKFIDRF